MLFAEKKSKKAYIPSVPVFCASASRCFLSMSELYNFVIDEEDGYPGFHIAAYDGKIEFFMEHLAKDEEMAIKEINRQIRPIGVTPLRLAIGRGHIECASFLIQNGADVDLPDFKAQTPLFIAVKNHDVEAVQLLLEAGANPNGDSNNLSSPLYTAARDGFVEGIKLLIKYGANVEPPLGRESSVPLHVAVTYQHYDCFITLLKAGADPNCNADRPHFTCSQFPLAYIPHCTVAYNLNVKFLEAYVESGGRLLQSTGQKHSPILALLPGCPSKECLLQYIGKPLKLKSQCRLAVRHFLGKQRLSCIPDLPLPSTLVDYLMFDDFLLNDEGCE